MSHKKINQNQIHTLGLTLLTPLCPGLHFGCSLELMTKLDDIKIPLEIDSNMILIVLRLTQSIREIMNGG